MTQTQDAAMEELKALLAGLQFTSGRADFKANASWIVYAHPWTGDEADGEDESADGMTDGRAEGGDELGRRQEARFDALLTIRAREDAGSAEGLRVSLSLGGVTFLAREPTNLRGQVWFRELPASQPKAEAFRARLLPPMRVGSRAPRPWAAATQQVSTLAAAGAVEPEAAPEPRRYYLADRRIFALFERMPNGVAVVTVQTLARELEGWRVRIGWAGEQGEVALRGTDPPGRWAGRWQMQQPYEVALRFADADAPEFEVLPPD